MMSNNLKFTASFVYGFILFLALTLAVISDLFFGVVSLVLGIPFAVCKGGVNVLDFIGRILINLCRSAVHTLICKPLLFILDLSVISDLFFGVSGLVLGIPIVGCSICINALDFIMGASVSICKIAVHALVHKPLLFILDLFKEEKNFSGAQAQQDDSASFSKECSWVVTTQFSATLFLLYGEQNLKEDSRIGASRGPSI